jgi:hypothetical protein
MSRSNGPSIAIKTIHELYCPQRRKESSLVTGNNPMVFLVLIGMIIALGGSLYIRTFLTRRAIFKVIEIFYQLHALGMSAAKTRHELGLERPDFFQKMMKLRDYKQYALQILMKKEIILEDEEGRLYMVEGRLDQTLRSKGKDMLSRGRSS